MKVIKARRTIVHILHELWYDFMYQEEIQTLKDFILKYNKEDE